jgi:hypothetical protein
VKKYGVKNHFTNLSSLLTYDENGAVDYCYKFDAFDDAYSFAEEDAGVGILENLQDRDFRSALNLGGWKPRGDSQAMAIEVCVFQNVRRRLPSSEDVLPNHADTREMSSGTKWITSMHKYRTCRPNDLQQQTLCAHQTPARVTLIEVELNFLWVFGAKPVCH